MIFDLPPRDEERYVRGGWLYESQTPNVIHTSKECPSYKKIGNVVVIEAGARLPAYIDTRKAGWCEWCYHRHE